MNIVQKGRPDPVRKSVGTDSSATRVVSVGIVLVHTHELVGEVSRQGGQTVIVIVIVIVLGAIPVIVLLLGRFECKCRTLKRECQKVIDMYPISGGVTITAVAVRLRCPTTRIMIHPCGTRTTRSANACCCCSKL